MDSTDAPPASPTDAAGALARADAARDGDAAARDGAVGTYAGHADAIDPATPEGAARVAWLVGLATPLDVRFEGLLRRAAQSAADAGLRDAAEVTLWQFPHRRGDARGAEAHLLPLHRRHRGSGSLAEIGVANNLAHLYVEQGREFEALVLARHAVRCSQARSYALGLGIAWSQQARVLAHLGEWDSVASLADDLEDLLPDLDAAHVPHARRALHTARMEAALGHGDTHAAREEFVRVRSLGLPSRFGDDSDAARLEIRIALAEGRPRDGVGLARGLAATRVHGSRSWLYATALRIRSLAACGRVGEAAAAAEPVLALIRDGATRRFGAAEVLFVIAPIGSALDPDPAAASFHEAVSQLVLERIAEIHACFAEIGDLPGAVEEDRPFLVRWRFRFLAEHAEMLHTIARRHDRPGATPPALLSSLADDGRLRVCAWCLALERPDGTQLPVGHLLPDTAALGVTHGICAGCSGELRSDAPGHGER